jgi:hypothetical protein
MIQAVIMMCEQDAMCAQPARVQLWNKTNRRTVNITVHFQVLLWSHKFARVALL